MRFFRTLILSLMIAMMLPTFSVSAASEHEGKIIQRRGTDALYYVGVDGRRHVFPNEKTYKSWFFDFNDIEEVDDTELALLPLGENVVYRPGVLLIKIQTDPKVYAIGKNGVLRWLKTEGIARQLYGQNWAQLIDDISAAFFANYTRGEDIDDENDFDPDEESNDALTIDENRGRRIANRIRHRLAETRRCLISSGRLCRIDRNDDGSDDDSETDRTGRVRPDRVVVICHIPPGNPAAQTTIRVGRAALRAHLQHGDTIGACEGDQTEDTTAPIISAVTATPTATSATITWNTNEPATSKVSFASQPLATAGTIEMVNNAAQTLGHSLNLTGLTASTTYFFMVESTDAAGNTATSTEQSFTTTNAPEPADTTPPIISDIQVTASTTSAIIEWTTDEAATSKATYDTVPVTASSTDMVSDASLVTSHSLELTGLTASTTYYFIVESTDAESNTATGAEDTFDTAS